MRILSMRATFGKLNGETLELHPGLNVITAPNEWGKSTWSAFILCMFYGIDTGSRRKKDVIPDKERYVPWSGEPMSGRMDILWQGRAITLERKNKGRIPFGDFRAYETETGINIPELTGDNCGITLLGVEKSVFQRSGFLRLQDLPVTEDEALRQRLNALVTTGDESGTKENLEQKLKELANKIHHNVTGLLPEAQLKVQQLQQQRQTLSELTEQKENLEQRQRELLTEKSQLETHLQHLHYQEQRDQRIRADKAREELENLHQQTETLENICKLLPSQQDLQEKLEKIRRLQERQGNIDIRQAEEPKSRYFPGMDPQSAADQARKDTETYRNLEDAPPKSTAGFWIPGILLVIAGCVSLALKQMVLGVLLLVAGAALTVLTFVRKSQNQQAADQRLLRMELMVRQYGGLPADRWIPEAEAYQRAWDQYRQNAEQNRKQTDELGQALEELGAGSLLEAQQQILENLNQWNALSATRRQFHQALSLYDGLMSVRSAESVPEGQDPLNLSRQETDRQLEENRRTREKLHSSLGRLQGKMDGLPQNAQLEKEISREQDRIHQLRRMELAVSIAQKTRELAAAELQRKFAPRISGRAQELFSALTEGRYDRVMLDENLELQAGAVGENTMLPGLWRSDGTLDQLYLALRLAVAEELTPDAPLILDDALVRFDDDRLSQALRILRQEDKQVILFTCQSREETILRNL